MGFGPVPVRWKKEVYEEALVAAFANNGYKLKVVEFKDAQSFTFLGLEWFLDRTIKIRMAFPVRSFMRLKFPLKRLSGDDFASQLKNYSINFINNPEFYKGLVDFAARENVVLYDKTLAKWVMDGVESGALYQGQIEMRHDSEGEIEFYTSVRGISGRAKSDGNSNSDGKSSSVDGGAGRMASPAPLRGSSEVGGQSKSKRRRENRRKARAAKAAQEPSGCTPPAGLEKVPHPIPVQVASDQPTRPPLRRDPQPHTRGKFKFFNAKEENKASEEQKGKSKDKTTNKDQSGRRVDL